MKPQQKGFIINRSSDASREYESASDWGWWEQVITQASQQNRDHFEKYITTEERTLLDRQSSVIRAQYDMAKHDLLSNSSISVVQNIDIKLRNNGKRYGEKPKGILDNLKVMDASVKRTKVGTKMLNECCSYCNLTTAHVNELHKGQRHRLGVAHNMLERTGCVELSSRSSAIPRYKVDKRKHGKADRLKAKPVHSDTMNSNITGELQAVMIKSRPEKAQLIKYSSIFDNTMLKSKKIEKKYQQNANAELTNLQIRQDHLEHKAKCLAPPPLSPELSEIELNNSKYDSWYNCRQSHQEGYKLISFEKIPLQQKYDQKAGTPSEVQAVPRPPDITRKYRETVQKPNRKKWKLRFSERKERTETRRRIVLNNTKSVDSADNSTLREEYTNYNKNNVLQQAAEIKSSLALNIDCNKNNNRTRPWKASQPQTQLREISKANRELLATETRKEGNALKRCSCELKLHTNQSESESMILNVLNPTKKSADSKLLSSLFESNDFVVKSDHRESASTKKDSNNFTSISVLRAISKEAQIFINIKEDDYVSASSNLLVKPAIANLHEICEKSMFCVKSEVASAKDYQSQEVLHLSDRSTNENEKSIQKKLCIDDSQSTIRNVCREHRGKIFTNNALPSMINVSSLSLLNSQQLRKLPRMGASTDSDIITSNNFFKFKNISAVSFILSSVTIADNIRPTVCRRDRMIIPNSMDTLAYLEVPKPQPLTDSVLKSSSKISFFQSGSISNFHRIQQQKKLLIRNSLSSVSNTSTCCQARANNALVHLDSQNVLSISRYQLLRNIAITQSKEKPERFDEIQTLRKSPGKNALGELVTHSQFNRSFCTMNLRIPDKGITSCKHIRNKKKHIEEEPIVSVLYQKDLSIRPKNSIKTDLQVNNISKITRRSARKELSRVIKPSKSQKHIRSNLKKVKFQKNDQARVSKYPTLEKSLIPKSLAARHKQELQSKIVRRNRMKSSVKRLSPNCVPISSQEVAQMGTNLSINTDISKDIKSWPTSYPITSSSKNLSHSQRKDLTANNEKEIRFSQASKIKHQNGGENEVCFPTKTSYVKSQTQLRVHNNKLKRSNRLPTINSETGTNKGWKFVINKCIKTVKSMTTKKASIAVNTNMSAAHCYSKCKQWEQSCYFCTTSQDTPKINKLCTISKRSSNVECAECNDDNFLKRCSATMNLHKNRKVQDTSKINETYNQTVNNKISSEFTGPAKIIYQNPATYIYRTCDSYKYGNQNKNKHRTLGTRTDNSNMSPVSTITTHDIPLYKSKSAQSNNISKHQSIIPRNQKSYEIQTIFPLTCNKFNNSKSEIILFQNRNIKCQNSDESNIPNNFEAIPFYTVSNKNRQLKKIKEPNANKVKLIMSKGSEHAVKSSFSNPTNFKRLLIRFTTLFRRNNKTKANAKAIEVKPKVNKFNSKHFYKEATPSFKSLKQHCKHIKAGDDLKKCKSDRQHKESDCLSRSEKCKNLKVTKECRKGKLDKRHLQETLQSKGNNSSYQSEDAYSFSSKISNNKQSKDCSRPSTCYRQEKLCCGHAQILQPHSFVFKNRARLLRESLHKNLGLPQFHCLSDKFQPQKSVNFKKINCQIIKKDVGTNCIRKKRFKNKTKCVQAELWDEKTVQMMSGERKNDYTPQYTSDRMISARNKLKPLEINQKKCGRMMFGIKNNDTNDNLPSKNKDDVTKLYKKKYVKMEPNDKNQMKVTHTMKTKCKNFLKINKPKSEQAVEVTHACYRYVDCEAKNKVQIKKIKHLGVDNASKVKCTQTPQVKKTKFTKPANLAKTAVKALQVDAEKHSKVGKLNQIKCAIRPKKLIDLPFNSDGKKNESTTCDKAKQKNKYVKTSDVDPFICCKSTITDLIGAMTPVKQKPANNAARVKKTLSPQPSVNRENDNSTYISNYMKTGVRIDVKLKHRKKNASAMEALQEPAKTSDIDFFSWCAPTSITRKIGSTTAKQKNEETDVKAKKGLSSHKPAKTKDSNVFLVATTSSPKKMTAKTFAKRKRKKINAKTKTPFLLNKAVMTQNILFSSCCTNTTPSIDKKIETKIFAKHRQEKNTAKGKKALFSNKAVDIKGIYHASRSTNTTPSPDKKVEAKIYVKKKQDNYAPNTKTILACSTTKANRAGISVKVKKENNTGCRKQPHSDLSNSKYGKPFINGTQSKIKCKAKQINITQGEIIANKGKTKIYRTEDKQTSASSKCMPRLTTEVPDKYVTMMSANRTKQICCALFTAGAWHNSKAAISRSNQASATYIDEPLRKNLQVMTTHGVMCNMEKQRNSRKSKYVNAVAKGNDKERKKGLKIPLSKSSPCCICGNAISEDCKVKFSKTSTKKGRKDKKSVELKNKGEIVVSKKNNAFKFNTKPFTLQNVSEKVVRKDTKETIKRKNKEKKEARKLEKLNKLKNKHAEKQAREMEKLNKRKHKYLKKEAKKKSKLNKGKNKSIPNDKMKKAKIIKVKNQSVKKVRPQKKDDKKSKRKNSSIQKKTLRTKNSVKDARGKTTRIPIAFFNCSSRTQKKNPPVLECEKFYKTTFRRKMMLFIHLRRCRYFLRSAFRRLLGCLFFALGVIVWTPCICCVECCRECIFCCCSSCK